MSRILVLGSINIDNVAYTKILPQPGITVQGDSFLMNIGGKGANQACAAHFLGADVTFIGAVGHDDNGAKVEKFFDSLGLHYHLVKSRLSTGVALIIIDEANAENRILCVPGANYDIKKEDIDDVENHMQKDDILLVQLETNIDTVIHAMKKAKEKGLTVILNPAPYHELPESCFPYIDYFIPNEHELDSFVPGDGTPEIKAKYLVSRGIKNVIVTLGENGSIYVNKEEACPISPRKVKAVDTTAAGDSFCGSFAVAIGKGSSLKEALRFATLCSSITVTRKGAISSLPRMDEVIGLVD